MCRLLQSVLAAVVLVAMVPACTKPPAGSVTQNMENKVELEKTKLSEQQQRPIVEVEEGIYLGPPIKVALPENVILPPVFRKEVTLVGSNFYLNDIAERLTQLSGVAVSVSPVPRNQEAQSSDDEETASPLERARKAPMRANYTGTFEGLLDTVASHFAMHWAYLNKTGTVQFYNVKTETYTLVGTSGTWDLTSEVSNTSSTAESASGGYASEGSATVESSDTAVSGEQSLVSKAKVDLWGMTVATVESMLSKEGSVVSNMASGTITVTDHPGVLHRVEQYIDQINTRLSRQVAISIKVYSVELEDETSHGFNMRAVLDNFFHMGISTTPGAPVLSSANAGSVTATVLSGNRHIVGTEAVFQALSQHGAVARVASGSGVTMQNQPLPIQDVTRSTYVASSSLAINDASTTSSMTPGQVTTGFAATLVPNILDNNSVVLQYTLNLSTLDDIDSVSTGSGGTEQTIQLPQVSTRAFQQRVTVPLNSTLVLAGFEEDEVSQDDGQGFLSWGKRTNKSHRLIVVAIDVSGLPGAQGGQL